MHQFSPELVSIYQEYMLRKHNVAVLDSEAQFNLESLADLYRIFTSVIEESQVRNPVSEKYNK